MTTPLRLLFVGGEQTHDLIRLFRKRPVPDGVSFEFKQKNIHEVSDGRFQKEGWDFVFLLYRVGNVESWEKLVHDVFPVFRLVHEQVMLVGIGVELDRKVNLDRIEQFAAEEKVFYMEVSLVDETNIDLTYRILKIRCKHYLDRLKQKNGKNESGSGGNSSFHSGGSSPSQKRLSNVAYSTKQSEQHYLSPDPQPQQFTPQPEPQTSPSARSSYFHPAVDSRFARGDNFSPAFGYANQSRNQGVSQSHPSRSDQQVYLESPDYATLPAKVNSGKRSQAFNVPKPRSNHYVEEHIEMSPPSVYFHSPGSHKDSVKKWKESMERLSNAHNLDAQEDEVLIKEQSTELIKDYQQTRDGFMVPVVSTDLLSSKASNVIYSKPSNDIKKLGKKKVVIDVNIGDGRVGQISVSSGDNVFLLAEQFVKHFKLDNGFVQRLAFMLKSRLNQSTRNKPRNQVISPKTGYKFEPFSLETEKRAKETRLRQPIVQMSIRLGNGKDGQIIVRQGDKPEILAKTFVTTYGLKKDKIPRIARKIQQQMYSYYADRAHSIVEESGNAVLSTNKVLFNMEVEIDEERVVQFPVHSNENVPKLVRSIGRKYNLNSSQKEKLQSLVMQNFEQYHDEHSI